MRRRRTWRVNMERFAPALTFGLGRASRDVERARRALEDACRDRDEMVRLARGEGYGVAEIARHVNLSEDHVSHILSARRPAPGASPAG